MPAVKVGDINMYHEVQGEGDPIVLIPGLGGACYLFFRQTPCLAEEYRVIAIDSRGSGLSDKPDIPYSVEMMADDVARLLDVLGINRAHILGYSLGGSIAQHLSLRHHDKVASLILIGSLCGGRHSVPPDLEAIGRFFDMRRRAELPPEERVRADLPLFFTQQFIDSSPEIVEQWVAMAVRNVPPHHSFIRQL